MPRLPALLAESLELPSNETRMTFHPMSVRDRAVGQRKPSGTQKALAVDREGKLANVLLGINMSTTHCSKCTIRHRTTSPHVSFNPIVAWIREAKLLCREASREVKGSAFQALVGNVSSLLWINRRFELAFEVLNTSGLVVSNRRLRAPRLQYSQGAQVFTLVCHL